jgi:hypothetical protein
VLKGVFVRVLDELLTHCLVVQAPPNCRLFFEYLELGADALRVTPTHILSSLPTRKSKSRHNDMQYIVGLLELSAQGSRSKLSWAAKARNYSFQFLVFVFSFKVCIVAILLSIPLSLQCSFPQLSKRAQSFKPVPPPTSQPPSQDNSITMMVAKPVTPQILILNPHPQPPNKPFQGGSYFVASMFCFC